MSPRHTITIALSAALGIAGALALAPMRAGPRALAGIVAHDPDTRAEAWAWLLAPGTDGETLRAERRMERIAARLGGADGRALLDGAAALRTRRLWGWAHQDHALVLREIALRSAAASEDDRRSAAELLGAAPLDLDPELVLAPLNRLIVDEAAPVRAAAFEAACAWAGRDAAVLDRLDVPPDDVPLLRRHDFAVRVADVRPAEHPRGDDAPPAALETFARLDVAEADGSVHAAVLLAERALPREDATALAERWIRSFDDDEKRAGPLLAALIGAHGDLLQEAFDLEDMGSVRTTQRLALWAVGRPPPDAHPIEFAHRALHASGGDAAPDTVLCMLAAGRAEALALVTGAPPRGAGTAAVRWRLRFVDRFAPFLHDECPPPAAEDIDAWPLHLERLDVVRLVSRRRLRFDDRLHVYSPHSAEAAETRRTSTYGETSASDEGG